MQSCSGLLQTVAMHLSALSTCTSHSEPLMPGAARQDLHARKVLGNNTSGMCIPWAAALLAGSVGACLQT